MKRSDTKQRKTFTISKDIYDEFRSIADSMSINKSKFIENMLKEFIDKNKEK